jgi:hypothetical protein
MERLRRVPAAALLVTVIAATGAFVSAAAPIGAPVGASLVGAVWTRGNEPVPDALVRLRNVVTARIERMVRADSTGRFEFRDLEGGQYLVEVVDPDGKVLAVGHPLSLAPGETAAIFVRLGMREWWFSGFFGNAAAAAVSSAASLGLSAVRRPDQPVSPAQP